MSLVLLHDEQQRRWLEFRKPIEILSTHQPEEVAYYLRKIESSVRYHGLWAVGFIAYEAAPAFDGSMMVRRTEDAARPLDTRGETHPLLWFGLFDAPSVHSELDHFPVSPWSIGEWKPELSESDYVATVRRVKDYIRAGDTYQTNYTYRQHARFDGDVVAFFKAIAARQPGGYGCLIDTPTFAIASVSPELFMRMDGEELTTRPMKGTASRGTTTADDNSRANDLFRSEKNRAENLMIVDMMRNDLNRIARPGTVAVPNLFEIERYPTVLQMTSTVTAKTEQPWSHVLAALFPCSSITGAPKIRTMQIIAELERSRRGLYTGTIGYLAPDGRSQMSVAIRTAVIDKNSGIATYGVGGGIVWDSDPEDEYRESQIKARVLRQTGPSRAVELLETMRFEPGRGITLLERHLARLADSAEYFQMRPDIDEIRRQLQNIDGGRPLRIRLIVSSAAPVTIESSPLADPPDDNSLTAALAVSSVNSFDPLLYHKTTSRAVYEHALSQRPDFDDVLLFNERGELTEFTVGNLVLEVERELVTPPINCGVLPGTLRQELIDAGEISEQTLFVQDLSEASAIFRINSVRGWDRVELTR